MRAIGADTMADFPTVISAERILVGHCPNPDCGPYGGAPIVVLNDHESWPLVECPWCGMCCDTLSLVNRVRLDRGWRVSDASGRERELRPGGVEHDPFPWDDAEGPGR